MRLLSKLLLASLAIAASPALLGSQEPGADWRVGGWIGVAWQTPTIFGAVTDRQVFLAAVELAHPLAQWGRLSVSYAGSAIPVALVVGPGSVPPYCPPVQNAVICAVSEPGPSGRIRTYGFGLAPLGAEVKARVVGSLGILLNAQAGALRFTRDVPMDGAGQVNFTVGVSVVGRLNAGYRLTHMSNGGLRYPNPGLDASVWYLGWSR
jgi:hypothetical protein